MGDAFDPRLVAALMSLNAFAVSVVILLSAVRYPHGIARSLFLFGFGKVLVGMGFLLVALRAQLPEFLSVVVANLFAVAGFYSNYPAVRELQGKPYSLKVPAAMLLALAMGVFYFTFVVPDLRGVRFVTSIIAMAIGAMLAVELLLRYRGEGRAHIISGISVLIMLGALVGRVAVSLQGTPVSPDTNPGNLAERVFIIVGYLGSTMGVVTFILLCSDAFNAELKRLAATDALSGLANRRLLMERGEEEVRRAVRFRRPLSVLVVDIDHFKRINDTWGHSVGDLAIRCVARTCAETVREVDTVGRLGGEEFAVILPETALAQAEEAAQRLRRNIETARTECEAGTIAMTASIGVAALAEGDSFEELLRRADAAMYEAKHGGRNQVCLAAPLPVE